MNLKYNNHAHDLKHWSTLFSPESVTSLSELRQMDNSAQGQIKALERLIDDIRLYRQDLEERAAYLIQNPAELSIELKRERRSQYSGPDRITYHLTIYRTYPDGTKKEESRTNYPGKERHKAIAAYKAAVKNHPGAPHTMDIEKGRWER